MSSEFTTRQLSANGIDFALREIGPAAGRTALLFHGFPDSPHGWDDAARALAEAGFRVVAPFLRGYRPSGLAPDGKYDAAALAADGAALAQAVSTKPVLVVGHDWGTTVAAGAAVLAPDRVAHLVLVGIPHPRAIRPSLKVAWSARHFLNFKLPFASDRLAANDLALVDELYARWSPATKWTAEALAPAKEVLRDPTSRDAALAYYRQAGPAALKVFKKPIEAPTTFVGGDSDPAFVRADYEASARWFTRPLTVEMMAGGHFVHREDPERFAALLVGRARAALLT